MNRTNNFKWHPKVASRTLEKEATILLEGRMLTLNEVGTFIWEQFRDGGAMAEVILNVTNAFDVGEVQASEDVHHFVSDLVQRRLLVEVGE